MSKWSTYAALAASALVPTDLFCVSDLSIPASKSMTADEVREAILGPTGVGWSQNFRYGPATDIGSEDYDVLSFAGTLSDADLVGFEYDRTGVDTALYFSNTLGDFLMGAAGNWRFFDSTLGINVMQYTQAEANFLFADTAAGSAQNSAMLEVFSTTKGFLPPRVTTVQRDAIAAPAAGLLVYNSTTNKLNVRAAAAWEAVTSA